MVAERNHGIDAIKGFLILTVVLGHILLGGLDENPLRYAIYSFHMPAFFFISGCLIKTKELGSLLLVDFILKYWKRMMKMWLLAWVIYSSVQLYGDEINIRLILSLCYRPYYHLWFIPSLLLSLFVVYVIFKTFSNKIMIYSLLVILGLLMFNFPFIYFGFTSKIFCTYLIFVVLGLLFGNEFINVNIRGGYFVIVLYLVLIVSINILGISMGTFRKNLQVPMVMALCIFGLMPLITGENTRNAKLEFLGRNSLSIYLWHVMPIMLLKHFWGNNINLYYLLSFSILILFLVFMSLRVENPVNKVK